MHWFSRHTTGRPRHPDVLTPAEWRVLEHVRRGRSNPQIAETLGVSVNTVRTHVSSMLAKLEARDRAELAAWDGEPAEASRMAMGRLGRAHVAGPLAWFTHGWGGRAVLAAGAVALAAVFLVAIEATNNPGGSMPAGVESPAPMPTVTIESTEEPTSEPTSAPTAEVVRRSGEQAIDSILVAVEDGRPELIADRLVMQTLACVAEAAGIGGPPLCEDDEVEGAAVEVFPVMSCEGGFTREPEEMLARFVSVTRGLYAVVDARFLPATEHQDAQETNETWLVFHGQFGARIWGMKMSLDDDRRITSLQFGCTSPSNLVRWGGHDLPLIAGLWEASTQGPPGPPTTGVAALDDLLRWIYERDAPAVIALAAEEFTVVGCHIVDQPGVPEAVEEFLSSAFGPELYAVYQAPPPAGGWWLVYRLAAMNDAGARVHFDGAIHELTYPCGYQIQDLVVDERGRPLIPTLRPEDVRPR